jgi:two-component system capsular synthesis response regulator RcsB
MCKKILIAEDLDIINTGLVSLLKDLNIEIIDYTKYCDEAFIKIKKAIQDNNPYDLLITDLSFTDDYRNANIKSGEDLIKQIRFIDPLLKIIVYSVEDKAFTIKLLFDKYKINGFVHKGRNSMSQLKTAFEKVSINSKYISPDLAHVLQNKVVKEIDDYDIALLSHLAQGISIEELPSKLQKQNISPNSKSSIEKHLLKLKEYFKANNNTHLVAIAKDLGVI